MIYLELLEAEVKKGPSKLKFFMLGGDGLAGGGSLIGLSEVVLVVVVVVACKAGGRVSPILNINSFINGLISLCGFSVVVVVVVVGIGLCWRPIRSSKMSKLSKFSLLNTGLPVPRRTPSPKRKQN